MEKINPRSWSIDQVCKMISKNLVEFNNPNQRPPGQWDKAGMTLLIDSIFNMFIPDIIALHSKKEIDGKSVSVYDVIDGKQRLNILYDFKNDVWELGDMNPVTLETTGETYDLSGKKYSELPEDVQREIDSYTIIIRPFEVADDEDEEEIVNMMMYRLNNGKAMTREHLSLLAAPVRVREFVQDKVNNDILFTTTAHFPDGSIKKSGREMAVLQSLLLAGNHEFESFSTVHVEKAIVDNEITEEDFDKVNKAFEMLVQTFPERNKFVSKVNIPSFIGFIVNNNFDESVIPFLQDYAKTNKKNDPYRKWCGSGGTKISHVNGRTEALQEMFSSFVPD